MSLAVRRRADGARRRDRRRARPDARRPARAGLGRARTPRPTSCGCRSGTRRRRSRRRAGRAGVLVRPFAGDGVRVSVGEPRGDRPAARVRFDRAPLTERAHRAPLNDPLNDPQRPSAGVGIGRPHALEGSHKPRPWNPCRGPGRETYGPVAYADVGSSLLAVRPAVPARRTPPPHVKENHVSPTGPLTDDGLVRLLTHTGERRLAPRVRPVRRPPRRPRAARPAARHGRSSDAFDTEATSLQRQGELALLAAEPRPGGRAGRLRPRAAPPQDHVFPSYREHGVAHVRGVDLVDILRLFRGRRPRRLGPGGPQRFHLYTLVIGSHTLHATGYAMGLQLDGDVGTGDPTRDTAVIVYFGDGATAPGRRATRRWCSRR